MDFIDPYLNSPFEDNSNGTIRNENDVSYERILIQDKSIINGFMMQGSKSNLASIFRVVL